MGQTSSSQPGTSERLCDDYDLSEESSASYESGSYDEYSEGDEDDASHHREQGVNDDGEEKEVGHVLSDKTNGNGGTMKRKEQTHKSTKEKSKATAPLAQDQNQLLSHKIDENKNTSTAPTSITGVATTVTPGTVTFTTFSAGHHKDLDLLVVSKDDLKHHLDNVYFTKADVKTISKTLDHSDVATQTWYLYQQQQQRQQQQQDEKENQNKDANNHTTTPASDPSQPSSYSSEKQNDHMQVALNILQLSPHIKSLRFKLVPSKISECNFWNAVFFLLEHSSVRSALQQYQHQPSHENQLLTLSNGKHTQNGQSSGSSNSHNNSNDQSIVLHETIQKQNEEILNLRNQLIKTRKELESFTKSNQLQHKGKWVMSKESIEFLALDEEIKTQLREGKQKRLQDVHDQMKFILDTDDLSNSRGSWGCCGQTKFSGQCMS